MCGIAGFIYREKTKIAEKFQLCKMINAIAHRGPDAEGVFVDGNIALGHRRLSILDLSDSGKQPMFSSNGCYIIVFNGEIYNYLELKTELEKKGVKFFNRTDTEVILEAYRYWGADCVKRFNGMWAFCIYDLEKEELFFSRDRFGIKPLYFLSREDVFAFGSEIKAILAAFPEENIPSVDMIWRFLRGTREDRDELTYYCHIKSLERAGCMLYSLKTGALKQWKYWEVNQSLFFDRWIKDRNPLVTFRALLEDAVRIRLRADVEVGACLSGGLDSSVLVGISSKKYGVKMHTFSSIYMDEECDEREYVDAVNTYNNTIPHLIFPEPKETGLLEDFQHIVYHHDGPILGASLYSQYSVMRNISGHVKVVLDGQGADELFGGYIPYYGQYLMDILQKGGIRSKLKAIKILAIIENHWPSMLRKLPTDVLFETLGDYGFKRLFFDESEAEKGLNYIENIPRLFEKNFLNNVNQHVVFNEYNICGYLNTRLCKDLMRDSIPALLHNEDGNSMAFSIESRLPFLDYRIVEFALALNVEYKIRNEWTKWIIRKCCADYLPRKVARRTNKMGFPAPFSRWLRESNEREEMRSILYALGGRNIVPEETIDFYYRQHVERKADCSDILCRFLTLELWLRTCQSLKIS